MSYNILSQDLIEAHSRLYKKCDPASLQWSNRQKLILKEFEKEDAKIICLQEVNHKHYENFFVPYFEKLGFTGLYKKRLGDKQDGCAIFFSKSMFNNVEVKIIEYWRPEENAIMDRENVALVVVLQPTWARSFDRLIVANTHILFNPKRGDIKLGQLRILFAELQKLAKMNNEEDYHPTIVCGDFNLLPYSMLHDFIQIGALSTDNLERSRLSGQWEEGDGSIIESDHLHMTGIGVDGMFLEEPQEIDRESLKKIKHPFKFEFAYKFKSNKGLPFVSTKSSFRPALVDYIFYHNSKEKNLYLTGFKRLPNINEFEKFFGLIPNKFEGSDHLSLVAEFAVRFPN